MAFSPNIINAFFLVAVLAVVLPVETYAFGAGDIPDFAYLNDKAFRHGDIENILETLAKTSGAVIGGSGLFEFASSVIKQASGGGGKNFSKNDVKKVYFGNWLRDYSQAMDIAGLSKLSADTLVLIVSVLGFMTFGFSTEEFEVTAERLGVYLPVEHIDNPKGYAEKEGDARSFHPSLRPPVSSRELEIDPNTGMKAYIASENRGWDTSTAFIRRTFESCIEHGRRAGGREGADLWEAYRLLGTGLHTLEDLLAHSNWCELALRKMGHSEVFCHVGENVIVDTPNGEAPPLVTGTFGSADFIHSLLGEAGDKLSQASVTDLSAKINTSSQGDTPDLSFLQSLLGKLGGGGQDELNQGEEIKKESQAYNFDPNNVAPPEVQQKLLDLLKWHDSVFRDVNKKLEMVPGLTDLLEEFSNALNKYIYTVLAPYLGPILTQATGVLNEGSKAVIDNDDQYEVFDNPDASDPSHSLLSKDHFGLILNEPAGKIAQVIVENSVNLIVKAWGDHSDPEEVITQILEAFHHPYYATGESEIQNKMIRHMERWLQDLGSEASTIIECLTKESVRNHKNKRIGLDNIEEPGYGGCGHGYTPSKQTATSSGFENRYGSHGGSRTNTAGGYGSQQRDDTDSYGEEVQQQYSGSGYGRQETTSYGDFARSETTSYGRQEDSRYGQQHASYGRQERQEPPAISTYGSYGSQDNTSHSASYGGQGRHESRSEYEGSHHNTEPSYGGQPQASYGAQTGGYAPSYSQPPPARSSYGRDDNDSRDTYNQSQSGYGGRQGGYGDDHRSRGRHDNDDSDNERESRPSHGGGYVGGGYASSGQQHHQPGYDQNSSSGYAPSYGGQDDTFGAERLNIGRGVSHERDGSDSDEDRRRHRRGGHGHGHGHGHGYSRDSDN